MEANINYSQIDKEKLKSFPIVETYLNVCKGKIKAFPQGTWNQDSHCIIIVRFVLEVKLNLSKQEIPRINRQIIGTNKLWGALNRFKSVRKLINFVYPNQYNEFDFSRVPVDYWSNNSNVKKRLEYRLSENGYSIEDIPNVITYETLIKWGFSNPLKKHGDSPMKLIKALYPNTFKQYQFKSSCQGYSINKEVLREKFIEMLKAEEISFDQTPERVTQHLLIKYKFSGALKLHQGSPSQFILYLFPDRFTHSQFRKTNSYWNCKQNAKKAIKALVHKHSIPHHEIPRYFTKTFLKQNGLSGLLDVYHGSPVAIITKCYPDCFDVTEFQRVPNRYWYQKENRISALRSFCKKRDIKREELPHLNLAYFRKHFPRFISMVDRHYDSKYHRWIMESFPEHTFKPEEFKLHLGTDGQLCDSKEELTIHNFLINHVSNGEIIREGWQFHNSLHNESYLPDWILLQGNQTFIIEYFGLYQSNKFRGYTEKADRKIEFYRARKDDAFIPIMPADFRRKGFQHIKGLLSKSGIKLNAP